MTLQESIDKVWQAPTDRITIAGQIAAKMSDSQLFELMLLSAEAIYDSIHSIAERSELGATLIVGRGQYRFSVGFGNSRDGGAPIILEDRQVALITSDPTAHKLWGAVLCLSATNLLLALHYVREEVDALLQYPARIRNAEMAARAQSFQMPEELIRGIAVICRDLRNRSGD